MNILITGGLGLIGHNVASALESLGHSVVIVDNETTYGLIPEDELKYLMRERRKKLRTPHIHNHDILQTSAIEWLLDKHRIETVIHLASFPRQKVVNVNPQVGSAVMSQGLLSMLEASVKHHVKKFIYISSSMIYGDFENDVTEESMCYPQGQYGIMKLAGEWLVRDYSRRTGISHIILRPSAVYGPLDVEDRVVSKFMLAALRGQDLVVRGATEVLDFTYVDDAVQGIVLAAIRTIENQTYNITRSDTKLYTLLDAAKLAVELVGKGRIQIYDRDLDFPRRGRLCIDRARVDLGYNPQITVEEGFKKYHEWLTNSSYWQEKI